MNIHNNVMEAPGNSSLSPCLSLRTGQGWWPYAVTYAVVFASGLLVLSLLLIARSASYSLKRVLLLLNNKFDAFFDPHGLTGKVHFILTLAFNITYTNLTIWRSSTSPLYDCTINSTHFFLIVESIISSYLMINSIFRLATAKRIVIQWISLLSVVDIVTLCHPFVSLLLGYDWLGLRSLRFLWLLETSKILRTLPEKFRSKDIVEIAKIVSRFIGLWLSMSGMIQLLENSGDPWDTDTDSDDTSMSLWSSTYFTMVTMSTVGYGDVTVTSDCAQMLAMLVIVLGFILYTLSLPTLLDLLLGAYQSSKFHQSYTSAHRQEGLLIVVGNITEKTVGCFLKELLHPDKQDRKTRVLFLHPSCPTPGLCSVLKNYYTQVQYYQGSPLSSTDLCKCGLSKAKSVIVLADRYCANILSEDHTNLLRVASIKNAVSSVPVILQLLSHSNMKLLECLPGWDTGRDVVLCLNEWKMKMLAQTCITPGFCTLFSNLFFATGTGQVKHASSTSTVSWRELYITGACHGIYSTPFSASFVGMETAEVGCICYEELSLSLIAVGRGERTIQHDTVGHFMADQAACVQAVQYYCFKCHGGSVLRRLKPCSCSSPQGPIRMSEISSQSYAHIHTYSDQSYSMTPSSCPGYHHSFSFPPPALSDHIVVCVFACSDSRAIGLKSLFAPLQESTTRRSIVVVSNQDYFNREWTTLEDTSLLYFVPGHPLDSATLTKAQIEDCSVCIILTALAVKGQDDRSVSVLVSHVVMQCVH